MQVNVAENNRILRDDERFFAQVYFSKETVSQTTVSTGPMKMFRLEHETMNVCQRNVARFGHVECRFDKIS